MDFVPELEGRKLRKPTYDQSRSTTIWTIFRALENPTSEVQLAEMDFGIKMKPPLKIAAAERR